MVIYRTSVIKIGDQQKGQNLRLVLFSFIYFFLLSFFLCYQEIGSSDSASEVYLKARLSNLASDSAIVSVVSHLLQVYTEKASSSTPPALPVSPSQVRLMRPVSHIFPYKITSTVNIVCFITSDPHTCLSCYHPPNITPYKRLNVASLNKIMNEHKRTGVPFILPLTKVLYRIESLHPSRHPASMP
jgi:hypothetical protein